MAKHVFYSGDVQGVGFRATATSIARRHPAICGWVRNLPDGRVELLADGPADAIDDFLADIREQMADYIQSEDIFAREADDVLVGFRVAY
jgi:acylphosphatase